MDINNINISKIESYLNGIIDNSVSVNTFVGDLPTTIDSSWNDMVLIDCPNGISDYMGMGRGTILIWLYAKPMANGIKNVAVMSRLEQSLNEVLSKANNEHYQLSRKATYQDFDAIRQWHCNIVELNLQIF